MKIDRQERILEIFIRGLRGEDISVSGLANEYNVSPKSISRAINDIKAFFADHCDLVGNTELKYSYQDRCYHLNMDEFLTNEELFALVEVIIGSRAFPKYELLSLVDKLKRFTTADDRPKLSRLIQNELCHYSEVAHDCENVSNTLWKLNNAISEHREITIDYYRANRIRKEYRIRPAALMFADSYFYMIAFEVDDSENIPKYFRVDRVVGIVCHRECFNTHDAPDFDEGLLRRRSLFMWSGRLRTIRFEYTGISSQAALDRLPTAKIIGKCPGGYIIEAEVYGDGIMMWLLSQGEWVKVISPPDLVDEFKRKLKAMLQKYGD